MLSADAHLCRAKCLLARASSRIRYLPRRASAGAGASSKSASSSAFASKRKRGGGGGGSSSSSSGGGGGNNSTWPNVLNRSAVDIEAALRDSIDAFHAVCCTAGLRDAAYLLALFYESGGKTAARDRAAEMFLALERKIERAGRKRFVLGAGGESVGSTAAASVRADGGAFMLSRAGLEALAREWAV